MSYITGILGSMSDTAARLLGLLSLLQRPRDWPGSELAERLRVSPRTIRRDIQRLRDLGYPVQAAMGAVGGYRLVAGTAMPPLLLDDEEAVAIAVGLRTAASHAIDGIEEASLQALAKLDQVLPSRLRYRVRALSAATIPLPAWHETPTVDPEQLTALAAAVADHQQLRFGYRAADGTHSRRLAEPHRLVAARHRWYLVAYDNDRHDWRVFRVDRMREPQPTGLRAGPRELPEKDVATYLTRKALAMAPHLPGGRHPARAGRAGRGSPGRHPLRAGTDRRADLPAAQPRRYPGMAGVPTDHARLRIPGPRAAGARQVLARARRPGHPRGRRSSIGT